MNLFFYGQKLYLKSPKEKLPRTQHVLLALEDRRIATA